MSRRLLARALTEAVEVYVLSPSEIMFDQGLSRMRLGDGEAMGGLLIATFDDVAVATPAYLDDTAAWEFGSDSKSSIFRAIGIADGVNYAVLQNAANGGAVSLSAQGFNDNIPIAVAAKGSAYIYLGNGSGVHFEIGDAGNVAIDTRWGARGATYGEKPVFYTGSAGGAMLMPVGQVLQFSTGTLSNSLLEVSSPSATPGAKLRIVGMGDEFIRLIANVPTGSTAHLYLGAAFGGSHYLAGDSGTTLLVQTLASGHANGVVITPGTTGSAPILSQTGEGSVDLKVQAGGRVEVRRCRLANQHSRSFTRDTTAISGASIDIPSTINTYVLDPAGALATLTLNLDKPAAGETGAEMLITTTQAITSLTVNGNGGMVIVGAPSTLAAGASFRMIYLEVVGKWVSA